MPRYEYKVVPAPTKGLKGKGVKGPEARFSHALQELMNGLSGYGWEYQRAETLPSVERSGLTSTTTEWRNVLVFRRLRETGAEAFAPERLPPPDQTPPTPQNAAPPSLAEAAKPGDDPAENAPPDSPPDEAETPEHSAENDSDHEDNGVEETRDEKNLSVSLKTLLSFRKPDKSTD
jgi:hypothetical protein